MKAWREQVLMARPMSVHFLSSELPIEEFVKTGQVWQSICTSADCQKILDA